MQLALKDTRELKQSKNRFLWTRFVDKFLGSDGVFILRLIQSNTDDIATADITASLWEAHLSIEEEKEKGERRKNILTPTTEESEM